MLQDASNVREEAHVEHPVCLVQHQDFEPVELGVGEAEMIEQSSRRGHDHVHAGAEGVLLGPHAHAAEDGRARHRGVHRELAQVLLDLSGELAGGGQDEGARHAATLGHEPVEDGQQERRRLAAPRHGAGQHVAALRGAGEAHLLDAAEEIGVKPERRKWHRPPSSHTQPPRPRLLDGLVAPG